MSFVSTWWGDRSRPCALFRAYLDKTNGHFGIYTTFIDIILDWYISKETHQRWQEHSTKAWRGDPTEITMSILSATEEVSWQSLIFIHNMCLANVAPAKEQFPSRFASCEKKRTANVGPSWGTFAHSRSIFAFHFCLLWSHKSTLCKTALSICPQTN